MVYAPLTRCRRRGAFTLIEVLVALTLVAAIAAVVAPMFSDDSRLRVMAASGIIRSDIELAQVMTISHPDNPVVVCFDPDNATYWLAYATDPTTPLPREDTGEPYQVTLGVDRARSAAGVSLAVEQMTSNRIEFAAHGGLTTFTTTPLIKIICGAQGIQLSIKPATGTVTESRMSIAASKGGGGKANP
jgi:prepilin-type N-terminal cleavage/methylation domain-containing protein